MLEYAIFSGMLTNQTTPEDLQNLLRQKARLIEEQRAQIAVLEEQVSWLKKQLFGSESERSVIDPGQESLPFDEIDVVTTPPEILEQVSYQRRKPVRNKGNAQSVIPTISPLKEECWICLKSVCGFGGKRKSRSLRT
jgi:hypothetical protein